MTAFRRILLGLMVLAILASPVFAVLNGWLGGQHWPMKHLSVSAPFHFVSQAQIQKTTTAHLKQGFFAVDLALINRDLSALHWVERVEVRKKWPDTLVVKLQEFRPLAVWNVQRMLAEQGSIFAIPNTKLPMLPQFYGPDLQAQELRILYQHTQPLFNSVGLRITELRLNERNAWRIVLSDGLIVDVGRNDVEPRIARFIALLPKIKHGENRQLLQADLRYTNGFTLVWKNTPQPFAEIISPQIQQGQTAI